VGAGAAETIDRKRGAAKNSAGRLMQPAESTESVPAPAVRKVRIAHLVSHPVQYLAPIYRQISKSPDVDFTVYFYSDTSLGTHFDADFATAFQWSTPLLGGYKHRLLPSSKGKPINHAFAWPNWDLLAEIVRQKYDVIWINSYIGTNALLARIAALFAGTPVFFRDDTNLLTPRPLWKRALKNLLLRNFLRGAWALYVGEQSRQYWQSYGLPTRRLFFAPHCVDNEYWSGKARELIPKRALIRRTFGIGDGAPVVLFCGKFIPKKQPLMLLSAFAIVRKEMPCWLLMAGDGPLRMQVERQIHESKVEGALLPGFLNQNELPFAYAAADVFVLPSAFHETWGLVVNEAMNFSLPIVVSDQVGCTKDLVKNGWNGFSFAHDDEQQLVSCLRQLIGDAAMRKEFGANSAKLVAGYSVEACADGIVRAGCAAGVAPA
jgi:glycosyltransferase involved in cell wall biosynthesis